uniref:Uncharacterized protein n=1 Tax=Anguilla anguilla TaxID=7936 RepID=A0A0E9Q5I2_ANGAN
MESLMTLPSLSSLVFCSAASISCCSNCILSIFCSSILFLSSSSLASAICSNRARMSTFCLNERLQL